MPNKKLFGPMVHAPYELIKNTNIIIYNYIYDVYTRVLINLVVYLSLHRQLLNVRGRHAVHFLAV